ncbi:MAG TPA: hypothetical protein VFT59_01635 [Candidatus Saccharimonadales bacterium]|nr:hypothetical protein [Candidatus Saccharimonadales bacterium]
MHQDSFGFLLETHLAVLREQTTLLETPDPEPWGEVILPEAETGLFEAVFGLVDPASMPLLRGRQVIVQLVAERSDGFLRLCYRVAFDLIIDLQEPGLRQALTEISAQAKAVGEGNSFILGYVRKGTEFTLEVKVRL